MTISPAQCRAARALLAWLQDDLARAANIGNSTVRDFEKGRREISNESLRAIRAAIENAGIELLPERGGKGVGVRCQHEGIGPANGNTG